MRRMGLAAIYRRPRTSRRHRNNPVFPSAARPNDRSAQSGVAADITNITMARGFVYLTVMMDWSSRKVLPWCMWPTLSSDSCVAALDEAVHRYSTPEIFNTDQGLQFMSVDFLKPQQDRHIRISMDRHRLLGRQRLRRTPLAITIRPVDEAVRGSDYVLIH